jgi:hypothetical protein
MPYPGITCAHEPEIVVHWHRLILQAVHREFSETKSLREGHSTSKWSQCLLQLHFTAIRLLLKLTILTVMYGVTVLYTHLTALDKCLFGSLKNYLKKRSREM